METLIGNVKYVEEKAKSLLLFALYYKYERVWLIQGVGSLF